MNYKLSQEAKFDLINIHHFGVYRFGEIQADKYYNAFFKQFEIICRNPYLFPSVDYLRNGYRKCVCGSDTIYFQINKSNIDILAIIGSQDIKKIYNHMKYTKLSNTNIKVSKICLGTMTFGEQNTEKEGHEQLDFALDNGVNFVDTAEMYSVPGRKETQGSTEKIIGSWIAKRQ